MDDPNLFGYILVQNIQNTPNKFGLSKTLFWTKLVWADCHVLVLLSWGPHPPLIFFAIFGTYISFLPSLSFSVSKQNERTPPLFYSVEENDWNTLNYWAEPNDHWSSNKYIKTNLGFFFVISDWLCVTINLYISSYIMEVSAQGDFVGEIGLCLFV